MKISHAKSAAFISLVLSVISTCDAATAPASESGPCGFAEPNSAANLSKEGKDLLSGIFIGKWDTKEFKRPGRWAQMENGYATNGEYHD